MKKSLNFSILVSLRKPCLTYVKHFWKKRSFSQNLEYLVILNNKNVGTTCFKSFLKILRNIDSVLPFFKFSRYHLKIFIFGRFFLKLYLFGYLNPNKWLQKSIRINSNIYDEAICKKSQQLLDFKYLRKKLHHT